MEAAKEVDYSVIGAFFLSPCERRREVFGLKSITHPRNKNNSRDLHCEKQLIAQKIDLRVEQFLAHHK